MNLLLSIVLIAQFILYTYLPDLFNNLVWGLANSIIRLLLIFHTIIELVIVQDVFDHILTVNFMTELILTVPYFVIMIILKQPPDIDQSYMRHVTFTNLVAVFKLKRLSELIENEVNKQLVSIFITILTVVLIFAGLIQYIYMVSGSMNNDIVNKERTDNYGFYDYIFFVMTIVSTVGYENPFF